MHVITISCPDCGGEGYCVREEAAFSEREEAYLPREHSRRCPLCAGDGDIDVCACCREPFRLVGGEERCACPAVAVQRAA